MLAVFTCHLFYENFWEILGNCDFKKIFNKRNCIIFMPFSWVFN